METVRFLRFGWFELDVRSGELRKRGVRVRLPQQSFQLLLMLLEHPGEVVFREDIRRQLWPTDTIVEYDHSINAIVKRLRNALGESAELPRHIERVAKRGYRFVGEVERVLASLPAPDANVVGHYRLLEKVGADGMGVVYRAEDLKLQRQVAVKFLSEGDDHLPESLRGRFEREARAASALNHPHICTVHGMEDFAGKPAIVMELVEGETLAARLAHGPVPLADALRIARQIAGALAEAHNQGVIHRDLKPANIMLTRNGVKVLDFGLAKMERAMAASAAGAILGTLHYLSPEQAQGKDADPRSDIFAFGLVFYEMVAGRRAFDGDNAASVMAAISEPRFNTTLLALFAAIAVSLAAVGIYGLIAYSVAQRTHEIGVRIALGAARADVVAMVVRQDMSLAAIGIVLGLAGAFALIGLLKSMLFGIGARIRSPGTNVASRTTCDARVPRAVAAVRAGAVLCRPPNAPSYSNTALGPQGVNRRHGL